MDFITLHEAIQTIADTKPQGSREPNDARDLYAWRISAAAAELHQIVVNATDASGPRWVAKDPVTLRPVYAEGRAAEGLEMLAIAAGWDQRRHEDHMCHLRECFSFGKDPVTGQFLVDPATSPRSFNLDRGMYGKYRGGEFLEARAIGFDRADLACFLTESRTPHRLGKTSQAVRAARKHSQAARKAEAAAIVAPEAQRIKRAALIERHRHQWTTIERDLKDASANGLSTMAKANGVGWWIESRAIEWARVRGKLASEPTLPPSFGQIHKMKG
jgi:hypothetical protein